MNNQTIRPLAQDFIKAVESPDPANIYTYTPGLTRLPDGKLLLTMDYGGPGVKSLPFAPCNAFLSGDGGITWRRVADFNMGHARPFMAGDSLYILGQNGDLFIARSDDMGETWSTLIRLTENEKWHQSACNVWYDKGCVYLVMEYVELGTEGRQFWPVSLIAPVLMRAPVNADLTKRESWTFAEKLIFNNAVKDIELDWFGVPFYPNTREGAQEVYPSLPWAPIGWLETNVVKITDPNHYWYDETGNTFHMFARAHTGGTGYCAMLKAVEKEDGTIKTALETTPAGAKCLFLPMPGGQMRFHILYDEQMKLYWLLSSQATDSLTRYEKLSSDRYNLPNNERHRLQLHFSRNCVDWCFAGIVAIGETERCSRHYASMIFDGNDLVIASRSGDRNAQSAHNGNFISVHRVHDFRSLVY